MNRYLELKEALRENRMERAGELCGELLRQAPDNVELLALAGTLAHRNGQQEAALRHFTRAAELYPALPELHNNAGVILEHLGRFTDAASKYRDALALRPRYRDANCNMGNVLRSLGRHEDAIACYRTALAIDPAHADSHLGLGNALRAAERWEEAIRSYMDLVKLDPGHHAGWTNLGGCLLALNRLQEAIAAERRAVALDPESADAHFNLALALLASGDLRNGWREYEWRLRLGEAPFSGFFQGKRMWDGSPLQGRTLLVRAEQGLGDALQFFRFAPLLVRQGARVVLECRPELHPLLASQSPHITCFALGNAPPDFDTFAYMMSLPYLLGATLETIPADTPYLAADPSRTALWGGRIQTRQGLRVGIVWAGSGGYRNDRSRSLPVRLLAPFADVPGISLFSLQLGSAAAELADEPWGGGVHDLSSGIADFADTAAIVANLDVVVSVDTAVAHLAGAMGKQVMLMLPFSCDWRWLHDRPDSPWYPSIRLYRQRVPGQWESVIAAIVSDLSVRREAATEAAAGDLNAIFKEANRLRNDGRLDDAMAQYRRLLVMRPDLAEVHNNLGLALEERGDLGEAEQCYERALRLNPNLPDGYNNLGALMVSRGDREAALPFFRKAIAARSDFVPAYVNLGSALQHLGRPEDALPLYRRAIELQPAAMEARINLGTAYQELMRPEQAVAVYEEALRLEPERPEVHWNLALSLLSLGRFERGWCEYEWRLHSAKGRHPLAPRWDGASLSGKTILLDCEQGLGDTLQFARYAPLVAGEGGRVLLRCQYGSLKPLLARVFGVAGIFARDEELPGFDCYSPLLSLPHIFGTTVETIPTFPYLTADPVRSAQWSARIGAGGGLKVGLVWRGGPLPQNRACPYHELAQLRGVEGVTFYTVQLGEAPDQRVLPAVDLAPQIRDFGDTAAIVANLDLVISVDTAMAHLAGGMGVPVWTMLPCACDWRWMFQRIDSPWYPTMKLFRQERRGDWSGVVARLREDLVALPKSANAAINEGASACRGGGRAGTRRFAASTRPKD